MFKSPRKKTGQFGNFESGVRTWSGKFAIIHRKTPVFTVIFEEDIRKSASESEKKEKKRRNTETNDNE